MKSNSAKQIFFAPAVIILGFAGVFFLSGFLERARPALPENYADEDLALQGARLKGYALGFEGLIADWYWMKSLQYVGDKILNSKEPISLDNLNALNPRLLYPYLDNATTLDPHFIEAFSYGAIVLPAIDEEKAIKIAEKGIENNPNEWRLYHHLGYIYWRLKNYEKAAEVYARGAEIQNSPPFMRIMAAQMKKEGGSRETARAIYRQMFEQTNDSQVKETASLRLLELDSLDEREAIQNALNDFQAKNNRCPNHWREILPLLKTVKLPNGNDFRLDKSNNLLDPTNAAYLLKNQNGKCEIGLDLAQTKIPAH